jgi:hypothetical protein
MVLMKQCPHVLRGPIIDFLPHARGSFFMKKEEKNLNSKEEDDDVNEDDD